MGLRRIPRYTIVHRTMQVGVPAVLMRGGTSRALVFAAGDLPTAAADQDPILLAAMGSPDPEGRQIDGVGGAHPLTSKVAIVGPSSRPDADVDYEFAQVDVRRPIVERRGNCGNISAAIGPFAVDQNMVAAVEPVTRVRIFNVNTGKLIVAHVPTRDGRFDPEGDFVLEGVPGTGSRVDLDYLEPGGSMTGALLPTGAPRQILDCAGTPVEVSIVDAANPVVFARLSDAGLSLDEPLAVLDGDAVRLARLETIRAQAAVTAGLATSPEQATAEVPGVPKMVFVAPAPAGSDADIAILALSMGRVHRAFQLTGGICLAIAAAIPGTLVRECLDAERYARSGGRIRIAHPAGVMEVASDTRQQADGTWHAVSATSARTARRLMEGRVIVTAEAGPAA
jgi:2-methylaconitate cis-trans-isomerase PrpF